MNVDLPPELQAALDHHAQQQGVTPETLVLSALRQKFLPIEPRDEWERRLLEIGSDCGVSPPHEALSSEGLYD